MAGYGEVPSINIPFHLRLWLAWRADARMEEKILDEVV
jgi:hypothetical protein